MHAVGHHLQIQAHSILDGSRDMFARSSYNRYYFGCFLLLRSSLKDMNDGWLVQQHKAAGEMLTGKVKRELQNRKKAARKIGDWGTERKLFLAISALHELRKIMEEARAIRVIADYEPEIRVQFEGSKRFSLNGIEITRAHVWQERFEALLKSVEIAWERAQ